MRLDLNGQVALTVAHQEIGLADPVRLVVDGEPAACDDQRPGLHRLHGLPLLGVDILGIDDDGTLHPIEEKGEGVVLVLVAGPVEHLQERRVGQRLAGLQDVELDALGALLGERGIPRLYLDRDHGAIVPVGGDNVSDRPAAALPSGRRATNGRRAGGRRCGSC